MGVQVGQERAAFADVMTMFGAVVGAVIGLALMLGSNDSGMAFHGFLLLLAGLTAAAVIVHQAFNDNASPSGRRRLL